jgi:signal transduction histidine kinase
MSHAPHPQGLLPADGNGRGYPSASGAPYHPDDPTIRPPYPPNARRTRGGPFRWVRTLRGRLFLIYAATLIILFVLVGVGLNLAISNTLYSEERSRLLEQATANVAIAQRGFDQAVLGHGTTCLDAVNYQQAFDTYIGTLTKQAAFTQVYLLDETGIVLAQGTTSATAPDDAGSPAPYFSSSVARAMQLKVGLKAQGATGVKDAQAYDSTAGLGQRIPVILIDEGYHTASQCVSQRIAVGFIEVVGNYDAVRTALNRLHFVLLILIGAAALLGILVGAPLAAQALRPLARMTATAQRIAHGDLSQRVRLPHGGDEIGDLAETFDEMIDRIESAFGAQAASEERVRQFVADASHELRTPLTSIRGFVDVLLRGAKDDPATAEEVLQATRREAERMSRLVNDLLTLARLDVGRPLELQPVDLLGLAGEAVDQARILAGEREVTLRSDGAGRLLIDADADRLKQVLLVLLDNALKYGRQDATGWVRVQVGRTTHGAFASVADNGEGIPDEDLPHIFDRFYRAQRAALRRQSAGPVTSPGPPPAAVVDTRGTPASRRANQREGSGLGLAIAQAIARAHGGALTVRSQLGAGTTFTVELPLPQQPSPHRH